MYEIQAVIGDFNVIRLEEIPGTRIVTLPQEKVLIPFSKNFKNIKGIPDLPFTYDGEITLHPSIADFCRTISTHGKIAYVEAMFFGGTGTQAHSLWNTGLMIGEPQVGLHAINRALKFLGVKKKRNLDEFDTLNLGKFRRIEDWLAET